MSQTNYFFVKTPTKNEIKSFLDNKPKYYIPPAVNCLYTLANLSYVFKQNEFTKFLTFGSFLASMFHSLLNMKYETKEGFLLEDEGRYAFITKEYNNLPELLTQLGRGFIGMNMVDFIRDKNSLPLCLGALITSSMGFKSFFSSDPIFANTRYNKGFAIDGEFINKKHFYNAFKEGHLYKIYFENRNISMDDEYQLKKIDSNELYDYNHYTESGVSEISNGDVNFVGCN
jgi:hypothetical protein